MTYWSIYRVILQYQLIWTQNYMTFFLLGHHSNHKKRIHRSSAVSGDIYSRDYSNTRFAYIPRIYNLSCTFLNFLKKHALGFTFLWNSPRPSIAWNFFYRKANPYENSDDLKSSGPLNERYFPIVSGAKDSI